jgi:hypothetical protein
LGVTKKVIGFRLIDVKYFGENIAKRITGVVEEFCLIDKIFSVTLDNACRRNLVGSLPRGMPKVVIYR